LHKSYYEHLDTLQRSKNLLDSTHCEAIETRDIWCCAFFSFLLPADLWDFWLLDKIRRPTGTPTTSIHCKLLVTTLRDERKSHSVDANCM